jgi:predicted Zn-dependent protease
MQWAIMERFEEPEAAASLFEQVLALAPNDVEAHANYGAVLLGLGRADEAVSALRFVVAEDPDHYWGWRLLGGAYEKQDAWDEARAAYQHAADVAKPGSKEQSVVVVGIIKNAVRGGRCEQAEEIAQLYGELLSAQSEEIAPILAECQK